MIFRFDLPSSFLLVSLYSSALPLSLPIGSGFRREQPVSWSCPQLRKRDLMCVCSGLRVCCRLHRATNLAHWTIKLKKRTQIFFFLFCALKTLLHSLDLCRNVRVKAALSGVKSPWRAVCAMELFLRLSALCTVCISTTCLRLWVQTCGFPFLHGFNLN